MLYNKTIFFSELKNEIYFYGCFTCQSKYNLHKSILVNFVQLYKTKIIRDQYFQMEQ